MMLVLLASAHIKNYFWEAFIQLIQNKQQMLLPATVDLYG